MKDARYLAGLLLASLLAATPVLAHQGSPAGAAATHASGEERVFGRPGDAGKATRTVRIEMSDTMRFSPAELTVRRGDTVLFVVTNRGKAMHEMVLGTSAELTAHSALMKKYPDMQHDEPYMVHVSPGKSARMAWEFTRAGEFQYGCLLPGHFEAGMAGRIRVTP